MGIRAHAVAALLVMVLLNCPASATLLEFAYTGEMWRSSFAYAVVTPGSPDPIHYLWNEAQSLGQTEVRFRVDLTQDEAHPAHWVGSFVNACVIGDDGSVSHLDLLEMVSGWSYQDNHVDLTETAGGFVVDEGGGPQSQASGSSYTFFGMPDNPPPSERPDAVAEQWGTGVWLLTSEFGYTEHFRIFYAGNPADTGTWYRAYMENTGYRLFGSITYFGAVRPCPDESTVPEPTSMTLVTLGIASLLVRRLRAPRR